MLTVKRCLSDDTDTGSDSGPPGGHLLVDGRLVGDDTDTGSDSGPPGGHLLVNGSSLGLRDGRSEGGGEGVHCKGA
jgi:hypothetical protein